MGTIEEIIAYIRAQIYSNGTQRITGNYLQDVLVNVADALEQIHTTDIGTLQRAIDAVNAAKAALNGSSSEDFEAKVMHAFQVISDTSVIGNEVVGETVAGDKLTLHNPENEALTDVVPGGQSEDIEVAMPQKSGRLALQGDVDDAMAQKANIDGFYGGMTVGAAENLVGRGSVPAEIQGIRTSAGTADIGSGAAQITRFKGASIVWNQKVQNGNFAEGTTGWSGITSLEDGIATVKVEATGSALSKNLVQTVSYVQGHTYIFLVLAKSNNAGTRFAIVPTGIKSQGISQYSYLQDWSVLPFIWTRAGASSSVSLQIRGDNDADRSLDMDFSVKSVMCIDLTLMFGNTIANALTVEDCERLFPLPYYGYNPGIIKNNEATALKTVGYNLYNHATGKAVLLGKYSSYPQEYEICGTFTSISFEDYAGNVSTPALTDGRFFNVDRPGVLTVVGGNDTDTLVHLVWSGWRNSDQPDYAYEPYWENILLLNIKTITGRLNGAGESVTIFPDGVRGVGSACDYLIVEADGYARTAVKVMEGVDMGTLTWAFNSAEFHIFRASIPDMGTARDRLGGLLSSRYAVDVVGNINDKMGDKSCKKLSKMLFIRDTSYETVAAFQAAMSGVELIYELATPQFYTLDEPLYMGYRVDDFGTEAKLPVDTADNVTAPIAFDVRYPMNAVDAIRNLPTNFLSKESTQNLLNALQSAGIIGGYTMTYDATAKEYNFAITAPTTPESNEA